MAIFGPATLADGDAIVVPTGEGIRLTIITGAGATATYSRVDDHDASAHGTTGTVAASTRLSIDTDWPYYRVSVAGGTCRVAVI